MTYNILSKPIFEFATKPIPFVKIALIGLGQRGLKTLERYTFIEGIDFVALADLNSTHFEKAKTILKTKGFSMPRCFQGDKAAEEVCKLNDVDLIIICTDWFSHTSLAQMALKAGKHVALEIPAALSIQDCYKLLETAVSTQKHLFLLENCCFDPFALATLNLAQNGKLGEIKHCEGAYFHDLYTPTPQNKGITLHHWLDNFPYAKGDVYPTHGIGPIAHLLNIHRGDCFTSVYALTSAINAPFSNQLNSTLLQTKNGKSVLLQIDLHTPQPYSRRQTVYGTEGYVSKYPLPTVSFRDKILLNNEAVQFMEQHLHPVFMPWYKEAKAKKVENEMNYIMDARFIYCLRNGLPLDIDIYDAVEWSCITELTALSAQRNAPISFPDFTFGNYRKIEKLTFYT